jgi:Ca2+-binding RTX toxin-like protein
VTASNGTGITFTGSSRADNLTGNSGADTLNGGDGGDTLSGLDGIDTINGGAGADTIIGGAGIDTLTGGADVDTFSFSTADIDTTLGVVTDLITDFTATDGERIGGWGVAGSIANYVENGTSEGSFAALLASANTALDGTVKYYVGLYAGDAFLVYDNDGAGYTDVIQLQGVSDLNAVDQFSIVG